MPHLYIEAEFIHGLTFLEPFFVARIEVWLPKVRHGEDGVGAVKSCGQGVWVVEVTTNHFDAASYERLGSGFRRITGEAADAPFGLVDEGIGYRGALTELMS